MREVFNIKTGLNEILPDIPIIKTQEQKDDEATQGAKAELLAIDAASVRAIREYIASRADAPQFLKDKEAAAILTRAKLK